MTDEIQDLKDLLATLDAKGGPATVRLIETIEREIAILEAEEDDD